MNDFEFISVKSLSVRRGGAKELQSYVRQLGGSRPFIITDAGLLAAGVLKDALAGLSEAQADYQMFHDVVADPTEAVVYEATRQAAAFNADCIIGFGGGSSMDVAKLVALLVPTKRRLEEFYGVNVATGQRLPLILVPTTAGTGSEVTPISIITTESDEKKGVVSPLLMPDVALLDAELTLGLPKHITAATGIDAMVHAIEAYTSRLRKNVLSDSLARQALSLLAGSIHAACENGKDTQARENMLLGACLAGMAFANSPVAAVHALAYPLGAIFHIPHGLANSLVLAPVLRFNLHHAASEYAEIYNVIRPGAAGSTQERAEQLIQYVEALPMQVGLPTRLSALGVSQDDLQTLAADAMKQQRLLVNNPREMTQDFALEIYQSVL
ncbi:iron-containing alcohol dehydrogenase [Bordetella sp. 15P40C-2]|uniref:iron-containing alcohol dehydrogenase n=1 Tax=Bordetella sp. 15P40C-2 TaxID=2572246 RepID=UPI001327BE3F|nr:iron-containing alcohol dehydrogenase [Bordetella sp. 15P40C-2]MVW72847.1 iron-containing alcohol dehydrogenase [Bordetella sp. 15P40C-2]